MVTLFPCHNQVAAGGRPSQLEDLVRRGNMEEMVRNRMLDELAVPPVAGGGGGGGGSLASASASNLLDVAETASEAWSMDVLASDSERYYSIN